MAGDCKTYGIYKSMFTEKHAVAKKRRCLEMV